MNEFRIAFCTPCMNRRWQIEKTLGENLSVLAGTPHFLALCDYNSSDRLEELVRVSHAESVRHGTLMFFRTEGPDEFHYSKAKNLAHRLALLRRPTVLFSLDADNFIWPRLIQSLVELFSTAADAVAHNWSGRFRDGTYGRLAMSADNWIELGGYDERNLRYAGMGQDDDLLTRARRHGLRYERLPCVERDAIQNTPADKLANCRVALGFPSLEPHEIMEKVRAKTRQYLRSDAGKTSEPSLDTQQRFSGLLNLGREVSTL